jgi:hypothetical protein
MSDTMHFPIHRSLAGIGDTTIHRFSVRLRNAPGGEWPLTKRFEDKQALRALNVQRDRNAGWPTGRKAQGHGVPIVPGGVTPYQGAWESQVQEEGGQVLRERVQGMMREHRCSSQMNWETTGNRRAGCLERGKHGSGRGGWKRAVRERAGHLLYRWQVATRRSVVHER